ncbi:GSCOCG00010920001-RA-CDS, partial [Cotesia congregata]
KIFTTINKFLHCITDYFRHIFAVRESLKMDFKTQRVFQTADTETEIPECIVTSREYKTKVLSQHQKFKNASLLMKELASLVSEKSNDLYIQRMQNIRDLCNAYKNDEEVMIVKVINCHDQSINNHGIRINSDDGNLISSDGDDETVFKGQSQDNNDGASCSNENNTKVDTRRRNFERDYDDHSGTSRVGGDGINLTERSNNMS